MSENVNLPLTAQDILAALGFEARRLAAAVDQHAAGAPFPDPKIIEQVLAKMGVLNKALLQFGALLTMGAEGGMGVKLDG